jgi:hypothetical protein
MLNHCPRLLVSLLSIKMLRKKKFVAHKAAMALSNTAQSKKLTSRGKFSSISY